jgi:hypothetical protein
VTVSGRRILLLGVVGALCATAALAIAILLFSEFHETQGRILGTTALVALAGLLALPAAVLADQGRSPRLARAQAVLTGVSCSLVLAGIWTNDAPDELGKAMLTALVFALASTQAAALQARRGPRDSRAVRGLFTASLVLALVVAALVSVAAWAEVSGETYFRVLGALVVADALAVALQPVLARAGRPRSTYRVQLVSAADGVRVVEVEAVSFAAAAAKAIAEAERDGALVQQVVRLGSSPPAPG